MSTSVTNGNWMKRSVVPIIIDLGKLGPKKVKQLKKGQGPYQDEVLPAIEKVGAELQKETEGKEILPVVVLYRKKGKRTKLPTLKLFG